MAFQEDIIAVLGGGLTGLSAGYVFSKAGRRTIIFEADSVVGGLSRTIVKGDFRFDLGGHRFFTKNKKIESFINELMPDELLIMPRKSKIVLRGKFFDYPLRPLNSIFGLGARTTLRIITDYGVERLKRVFKSPPDVSLEDWVVGNFGRTMFNIYFKQYSEKVWGIDCKRISQDWVSKRISGLSLGKAIKNSLFRFSGRELPTLADRFLYPRLGIGRIAERLKEEIETKDRVLTDSSAIGVYHNGSEIESIEIRNCNETYILKCRGLVSTIPITNLLKALRPSPPKEIISLADSLGYRDLLVVALMIDRPRVTDQTWIYIPESTIPFGRIHEPTNWSPYMAPKGKTLLVIEYFCFKGDSVWNSSDRDIVNLTSGHLEGLGFIRRGEITDSAVIRVPKAYPLFEIGYEEKVKKIMQYLSRFRNLRVAGRGGMFRYYNMDHAIESGFEAAKEILN